MTETQEQSAAIDLGVLSDLMDQVGDDDGEMLGELIDSYLVDAAELIGRFGVAARASEPTTVLKIAHTLRSTSGLLGALNLVALLRHAEEVARGYPSELPSVAEPAEDEFARVTMSLIDVRDSRASSRPSPSFS